MWDDGRFEKENRVWGQMMATGILTGLTAGLFGSFLPKWVFFETSMFYADAGCRNQSRDFVMNLYQSEYFVYYLCIRVLIPFAFLLAGILRRGLMLLRIQAMTELTALAFQAVLVFGAGGMEKLLMNLCLYLLPENCVLLTIILAFCEKKSGFTCVKQYILTGIRSALLLCCGAVMEIYLFQYFM